MDYAALHLMADDHIKAALKEDMNQGDTSTAAVMPHPQAGDVQLICKQDGVIAGLQIFQRVFTILDPATSFQMNVEDGDEVTAGQLLGTITGDVRVLLAVGVLQWGIPGAALATVASHGRS